MSVDRSPAHLRELGFPIWKQVLVSGLFTGLSPIASGTVASAVAALIYFTPLGTESWFLLACSVTAYLVGIPLAHEAEKVVGPDSSYITIDEFAGQWLAMVSGPWMLVHDPYWPVVTFFVFRLFDIAKLWPASVFDRRPGGVGVMTDDMVAGLYACIVSNLLYYGYGWIMTYF